MVLSLGEIQIIRLGVHNVKVPLPLSNDLLNKSHLLELRELHVLLGMAFQNLEEDFVATITLGAEDNITLFKIVQEEIPSTTTWDDWYLHLVLMIRIAIHLIFSEFRWIQ